MLQLVEQLGAYAQRCRTLTPQADASKLEVKACVGDQCGAELWTRAQ